ncbi:MAG: YXWGXW repeat-containing protein, partial [Deltaproteobacteria bacterium]|nr:YXWGXW repeat-containing protein [Deltaproteobacteria bacterium]
MSAAQPGRPLSRAPRAIACALVLCLATGTTGCFRGGGRLFGAMALTALVTAAIVSSREPPPPRVVYMPPPHPGYSWQPGYWTLDDGEWEWVDGHWVRNAPGWAWRPTHWVAMPDGRWRLVPGKWVRVPGAPPPP